LCSLLRVWFIRCQGVAASPGSPALFIEPDVFHAVAVVDAVDHRLQPLDIGLRARPAARIEDDRPGAVLGQPPFDLPHQLFTFLPVGLGGLPVNQLVDFRIAVAGVVPHRAATKFS
jgi:hypothetical protein